MRWLPASILLAAALAAVLYSIELRSDLEPVPAPVTEWPLEAEHPQTQLTQVATRAPDESHRSPLKVEPAEDESDPVAVLVSGRVLGADGQGVSAGVRLWQRQDAGSIEHRARRGTARDGSFSFEVDPGREWQLAAEAPGHGTGHTEWRLGGAANEAEIQVAGSETLVGTVLDPAGAPLPGVKLWVLLAELHNSLEPGQPSVFASEQIRRLWIPSNGATQATVETNLDGEFTARGLKDGNYVVRVNGERPTNPRSPYRYADLLTTAPVNPAAGAIELTLEATILTIALQSPDDPSTSVTPRITWDDAFHVPRTILAGWGGGIPVITVDPAWRVGPLLGTRRSSIGGRVTSDGLAVFDVNLAACTVLVRGGGFDNLPRTVELEPGQRTHVDIVKATRPRGRLEISPALGGSDCALIDPTTGLVFWAGFLEKTRAMKAPSGEYLVTGTQLGQVVKPQRVTVRSEQLTWVDLNRHHHEESFLQLKLSGSLHGTTPTESDPNASVVHVVIQESSLPARLLRSPRSSSWRLGQTQTSTALAPGTYELFAETSDGRGLVRRFELGAGETLALSLDF